MLLVGLPQYTPNTTAEEHLIKFEVDLYQLKRLYERKSPSIWIQRFFRGYL